MPDVSNTLDEECFFVAPIGEDGSETRRRSDGVLRFIVGRAAEELGLRAVRADEIATPGQITLQVIDHILGARAVVADLTDRNPNVFYELAIRHAARLPIALIIDKNDPPLPFDIAQMRAIRFDHTDLESADQCRQAIVAHLQEGLAGAVDSPVATSIDLRALAGGNQLERSVAELVDSVEELNRAQRRVESVLEQISAGGLTGDDVEFYILRVLHNLKSAMIDTVIRVRNSIDRHDLSQLAKIDASIDWVLAAETTRRRARRDGWSEEKFRAAVAQLAPVPEIDIEPDQAVVTVDTEEADGEADE